VPAQCFSFAQNRDVTKLVKEGIELHDKGDYEAAIKKYDEALAIDKTDYYANYEKSYTCYIIKRYETCITISKYILDELPDNPNNVSVYSNYGSALDDKGESEKALGIYDRGINKYPGNYLLQFNKGLTLERLDRPSEALICYQRSLRNKPLHPSSNLYTGRILEDDNKVPALMASLVF